MTETYGNPSSLHKKGLEAEHLLTGARRAVAGALGGAPDGLVFTSGGTEANNLAILGAAAALRRRGRRVIVSSFEHASVLSAFDRLEAQGFEVVRLPVSRGFVEPAALAAAVNAETILVSVMLVNNETGAVNPVGDLAALAKRQNPALLFHTDAVQALGKLPFRAEKLGVDLLSVTAHKVGGPKGVGALWVKKGVRLIPQHLGGEQERGLRGGTEPVPLAVAFGVAAAHAQKEQPEFSARAAEFSERLRARLCAHEGFVWNSPEGACPAIVNLSVEGLRSEILLHYLEARGIYVSSGSACAQGAKSHVLAAMGLSPARVDSALRVSFGRENTPGDADALCDALAAARAGLCHR